MSSLLLPLIQSIESAIRLANAERAPEGLPGLGQVELRLLGQFGLLVHPHASSALSPAATRDIDATMKGDWSARWIVRSAINQNGYRYDDLSGDIWIPPGTKFELLHESPLVRVEVISPIFNLLSKAKMAPERNRNLIIEGIAVYGEELLGHLKEHGIDTEYFITS